MAGKNQILPAPALFGPDANTEIDNLDAKKVWAQRAVFLLTTPLAHRVFDNLEGIEAVRELFNDPTLSIVDVMHLKQMAKALDGDTKAYLALGKVMDSAKDERRNPDLYDPLVKMIEITHGALVASRNHTVLDAEFDDMFGEPTGVIDVMIEPSGEDEDLE